MRSTLAVEDTGGYPRLDSAISDAWESVFCYKDFELATVRERGNCAL
jgi:hypothetical protein